LGDLAFDARRHGQPRREITL